LNIAPITVCTAHIPVRSELLTRAIQSVRAQTLTPENHLISVDYARRGGPATLDSAIAGANTEWVATLDDDDEWLPNHLEVLYSVAMDTSADLVFSHFRMNYSETAGHLEPFKGLPFDNANPRQTTNVFLVKKELVLRVGGFSGGFDVMSYELDDMGHRVGYDFNFIKKLVAIDAKIVHTPEVTWHYHVQPDQTLGIPNRW
jgi:hypothetical protein